jgi:hypothetical protein
MDRKLSLPLGSTSEKLRADVRQATAKVPQTAQQMAWIRAEVKAGNELDVSIDYIYTEEH